MMNITSPEQLELNQTYQTAFVKVCGLMPPEFQRLLLLAKLILEDVLGLLTTPVEVCLRRRFGVRAISLLRYLQVVGAFNLTWMLHDVVLSTFLFCAVCMGGWHLYESRRREKSNLAWRHSRYLGDPIPIWSLLERFLRSRGLNADRFLLPSNIYRFGEPALCLLVGLATFRFFPAFGYFMMASAWALLLKMHIVHLRVLEMLRDKKDAEAMGQSMAALTNQADKQEGEQLPVVRIVPPQRPLAFSASIETVPFVESNGSTRNKEWWKDVQEDSTQEEGFIRVQCGCCGKKIKVAAKHSGRVGRCPACSENVRIPESTAALTA
jgi:hypothetical protein